MYNEGGKKGKHMSLEDRMQIWIGLKEKKTFKEIAEDIGKDPTTVSKEIRKHRYPKYKKKSGNTLDKGCLLKKDCKKKHICAHKHNQCKIYCRDCLGCHRYCSDFTTVLCGIENKLPYVCNGCEKVFYNRCKEDHWFYGAEQADEAYKRLRSSSREGVNLDEETIAAIDALISPLIKRGQSLSHIFATHKDELPISQRSAYRYVHLSLFSAKKMDFRRIVRFKSRVKKVDVVPVERKNGHTYDYFLEYIKSNPDVQVVEMDTVEGVKGGKVMQTIFFRGLQLMLIFLLNSNRMTATVNTFDFLEKKLGGSKKFEELIPVVLTDNGSEFADPGKFETGIDGKKRTKLFYCKPRHSEEKGGIEKNHEFIRYVLPKGESFDDLDQDFVDLLTNHINSYARPLLKGLTPMDMVLKKRGQAVIDKLGLKKIPADEILLTPELIKEYLKAKK